MGGCEENVIITVTGESRTAMHMGSVTLNGGGGRGGWVGGWGGGGGDCERKDIITVTGDWPGVLLWERDSQWAWVGGRKDNGIIL